SSTLKEEATQLKRLSQLNPPLIHAFLNCPHMSNRAADEEPRGSMTLTIAEICEFRQAKSAGPLMKPAKNTPGTPIARGFSAGRPTAHQTQFWERGRRLSPLELRDDARESVPLPPTPRVGVAPCRGSRGGSRPHWARTDSTG